MRFPARLSGVAPMIGPLPAALPGGVALAPQQTQASATPTAPPRSCQPAPQPPAA